MVYAFVLSLCLCAELAKTPPPLSLLAPMATAGHMGHRPQRGTDLSGAQTSVGLAPPPATAMQVRVNS